MKFYQISLALIVSSLAACAVDFKPTFRDKPVPANLQNAVKAAVPTEPFVAPKEERKILVFSATSGFRHGSIPIGKLALEEMGASTGAYEVLISDDPDNFETAALEQFDAVVLLNTTLDFFMPTLIRNKETRKREKPAKYSDEEWSALLKRNDRLLDNLVAYVKAGGGLVGIHAATDSCYDHGCYGDMIGAYFNGHPWMGNQNVTINVEDPEHGTMKPVFGDMESFSLQEEIYQFAEEPYTRERLRILLNLDEDRSDKPKFKPKRKDGDYAVAWVQAVGEGRVFYTSIGHNNHIYTNPLMLKHYLAGIQFAVGDLEADTTPSAQIK